MSEFRCGAGRLRVRPLRGAGRRNEGETVDDMNPDDRSTDSGPGGFFHNLATAEQVATASERIYGSDPRNTGVVHVMAAWQRRGGALATLRTGDGAPRDIHDTFALGLARARADAILTTGEILRREPDLRHDLPGPGALPRGLADWRRRALGKASPPVLCVMTRSGEIDLEHPALGRPGRVVIYGGHSASWPLESRAAGFGVELVVSERPSARDAVATLRREFGAATVVVEAGPSVARTLYEDLESDEWEDEVAAGSGWLSGPPPRVDELMLTVLHRDHLKTCCRGPSFLSRGEVESVLGRPASTYRVPSSAGTAGRDRGGDWELVRYVRR